MEGQNGFGLAQAIDYTVNRDGAIDVRASVLPRGRRIVLPRLGMRVQLDPTLSQLTYFARGPQENYPDRELGAEIARYTSTVAGQMTPYVAPMECGNHGDARWCALTRGAQGPGLRVDFVPQDGASVPGGASFSALPYTDEELDRANYARDLPPSTATVLCLAARTLGVGSAGCGPAPFQPYRIYSEPTVFAFRLTPLFEGVPASARLPAGAAALTPPVLVQPDRNGLISLGNAPAITYALGDAAFQPYTAPFAAPGGGRLRVKAGQEGALPFLGEFTLSAAPRRGEWNRDGEQLPGPARGEPAHAIDGDPGTYWHSRWSPATPGPHFLVIDTGKLARIAGLTYVGREDGDNGRIKEYEVFLSADGQNWGQPVAKGQFHNNSDEQRVTWPQPASARYVKLVAVSEVHGRDIASAAELDLLFAE